MEKKILIVMDESENAKSRIDRFNIISSLY